MQVTYATNGDVSLRCAATSLYALDVTVSGQGVVTSAPAGINCPSDCSESYAAGTPVTLTETPGFSRSFSGWGGACAGQATTCTVTMDQARSVTATFTAYSTILLTVANTGTDDLFHTFGMNAIRLGTQTVCQWDGPGTSSQCQVQVPMGQPVTFTAYPDPGDSFAHWSGACSSSSLTCTFTPSLATDSLTGVFNDS
jgi:hypothetical protein